MCAEGTDLLSGLLYCNVGFNVCYFVFFLLYLWVCIYEVLSSSSYLTSGTWEQAGLEGPCGKHMMCLRERRREKRFPAPKVENNMWRAATNKLMYGKPWTVRSSFKLNSFWATVAANEQILWWEDREPTESLETALQYMSGTKQVLSFEIDTTNNIFRWQLPFQINTNLCLMGVL